jgi:type I restriction enzyme S subunit
MRKGWSQKSVGDILQLEYGKPLDEADRKPNGRFPVYGANGEKARTDKFYHDRPSIIVGRKGSAGEINLTEKKFWPLDVTYFVKFDEHQYDLRFLYYLLTTLELTKLAKGVKPGINRNEVYSQATRVPPLPEQQRIVGILDKAFEGIATAKANAEQNLQNARALFESYLQSVLTQRGEEWVETTLGKIGKVAMCKRIFKEETTANGDIPFYKIGTFGKEPDAFIPFQTYNDYRVKYPFPKKGDVLISASGTIGRRVRYDGEPAYFQDSNIVWIENDEKHVLNDYLYHFYGGCAWNSTKGATISRLYNDNLKRIAIAFPESQQAQRRIVAQLDALSEEAQCLATVYERKHTALAALKQSLLHHAFSGEL